jgi:hypothetical protein
MQKKNQHENTDFFNLNFGFSCHEIRRDFEQIFASEVEDKGENPPLSRRRREKMPKTPEYQANKPEVQVFNHFGAPIRQRSCSEYSSRTLFKISESGGSGVSSQISSAYLRIAVSAEKRPIAAIL